MRTDQLLDAGIPIGYETEVLDKADASSRLRRASDPDLVIGERLQLLIMISHRDIIVFLSLEMSVSYIGSCDLYSRKRVPVGASNYPVLYCQSWCGVGKSSRQFCTIVFSS